MSTAGSSDGARRFPREDPLTEPSDDFDLQASAEADAARRQEALALWNALAELDELERRQESAHHERLLALETRRKERRDTLWQNVLLPASRSRDAARVADAQRLRAIADQVMQELYDEELADAVQQAQDAAGLLAERRAALSARLKALMRED